MNLFNNIIIDKLKLSYRKGLLNPNDRENINNTVKKY